MNMHLSKKITQPGVHLAHTNKTMGAPVGEQNIKNNWWGPFVEQENPHSGTCIVRQVKSVYCKTGLHLINHQHVSAQTGLRHTIKAFFFFCSRCIKVFACF